MFEARSQNKEKCFFFMIWISEQTEYWTFRRFVKQKYLRAVSECN